jgi:hypothetical protein
MLLLGPERTTFLEKRLDGLDVTLPYSTHAAFPMLGHDSPEDDESWDYALR